MIRVPTPRTSVRDVVRSVVALGSGGRPTARQTAVTAAWLAGMYWTSAVRTGEWEAPSGRLLLLIVAAWAPLLIRTYRPVLALLGTLVAESMVLIFQTVPDAVAQLHSGMGAYQPAPLATVLAVATLASRVPRVAGWTAGLVAGSWLAVIGVTMNTSQTRLTDLVVFYLVVTAAAAGVWRAGRRERAERHQAEVAARTQRAVLDERLRIARELHDVLAHNLTLVNAQAGVAKYLLRADVDAAERALGDIAQHTGRAIDELRATIGLLRRRDETDGGADRDGADDGDPTRSLRPVPGLAALDELVTGLASAGTQVSVSESGDPVPLAQHVDLAAYRIVQESLTNATKHAPGARVEVAITWTAAGVRLRVANPVDPTRPPGPGTRHGLIGMRERAGTAGGSFRAGPTGDGVFEVVSTLPADRGTVRLGS